MNGMAKTFISMTSSLIFDTIYLFVPTPCRPLAFAVQRTDSSKLYMVRGYTLIYSSPLFCKVTSASGKTTNLLVKRLFLSNNLIRHERNPVSCDSLTSDRKIRRLSVVHTSLMWVYEWPLLGNPPYLEWIEQPCLLLTPICALATSSL